MRTLVLSIMAAATFYLALCEVSEALPAERFIALFGATRIAAVVLGYATYQLGRRWARGGHLRWLLGVINRDSDELA